METTTDYKIFKGIVGNRDIYPGHVAKLREAIKKKNLLPYIPLLCNEHMQVIDGQHRLEVAKLEKLEVTYVIIPGLRLEDVMSLNTNSKSWGINDFVDAWIKAGKPDYQVLKDFTAESGLTIHTAAGLLWYGPTVGGEDTSRAIRTGNFEARYLEYARMLVEQVDDLRKYCEFEPKSDRTFLRALARVQNSPDFEFETLRSKLQVSNLKIEPRKNLRYYILELEDLYNWKNRYRVDLYASSANG